MNLFVFGIETVPDVAGGRALYRLDDLNVARAMFHKRTEKRRFRVPASPSASHRGDLGRIAKRRPIQGLVTG
jgi:hypothetical protein